MRVVEISQFGSSEVLKVAERAKPKPQLGEVLIRVVAAGINFAELKMREGTYAVQPALPAILGSEVVGFIEEVGSNVDHGLVGQRVAGPIFGGGALTGGYAEYAVVPASIAVPVPEAVDTPTALALQVQGLTAALLIREVPVTGRTVLVHAAAGGVGSLLVQLARKFGATRVLGAASNSQKRELALQLGADATIDYTSSGWPSQVEDETGGQGVDIIFDGGSGAPGVGLRALSSRGQLVLYGSLSLNSFALNREDIGPLVFKNLSVRGFALPALLTEALLVSELTNLYSLAAQRELRVVHGGSYGFGDASKAHRSLEARETVGKLTLDPQLL